MTGDLMEFFNLDAVSVSYVVSSFFYVYLAMQLPAGLLLDRYPSRYLLPATCFTCALGAFLMGIAEQSYLFVIARMLCGLGSAFGFIGTMRILRNYFTLKLMTLFIGFTEMMGFLLTAVCEHSVSLYLPVYGFHNVLFYFGLLGMILAGVMYCVMLPRFAPKHEYAPPVKHDRGALLKDFKELITNPQMIILGLISFSFFSLVTSFAALWGVPSLMSIHKLSLQDSTQAISWIFLGIATGGPLMGYLTIKTKKYKSLIFWCGIINSFLMLMLILMGSLNFYVISAVLYLSGILACCYLLCFTIANDQVPARLSGTCMGLINLITMTSALLMQPVMGYLVAIYGPIDFSHGAPVYSADSYKLACLVLVFLFLFASFLGTKLRFDCLTKTV